ncbi:MAG: ABC transporter ATP-binding protein [Thermotogae bacterium]|uniref:ATP-binding cassette domain-containing protein n=1 Tax=Kosmotoga arenicorallina TaxID=688066 RepID=A0A7C5HYF2_9BACT|nr:ATP-binding cassette domain-containing protein [Kosmotoga sp.]MBO8167096.1 ATP-binding cassette domain-containing protein [Kosmotoga sp.]MCD6160626.1 ATP-binding cassette domain-containing protein [Kosmotoga sp.]RKX49609.1 MAG: ABC transporter ATP-binding protein [Thermotogota bacterium]HHF08432.1 ATP-binding cassette domain-containing protein [Kosmotoga arenicorallina]
MLALKRIRYEKSERVILRNMTIEFEDGKIYAMLGNNGVGKSTLAGIIMGLENYREHTGELYLDDISLKDLGVFERAKLGITLALQEPVRFEGITIDEYLNLGGKLRLSQDEIAEALKLVGLSKEYLGRYVDSTLSGGERKRVELASIVLIKPKIVILDEPDSGIDIMSNEMIKAVVGKLKKAGSTVIMITHREEIAMMADEAYLMCGGRLLASGTPQEIVAFYKKLCDSCDHINKPESEKIRGGEAK